MAWQGSRTNYDTLLPFNVHVHVKNRTNNVYTCRLDIGFLKWKSLKFMFEMSMRQQAWRLFED